MKNAFMLLLVLISFSSCSNSNDDSIKQMLEVNKSYEGDFVSSAHPTSGKALVNIENTTLSFTNFKTDNGPVLEVYLATDTSASKYVSLGALKGLDGNYEYTLPKNIDFSVYNHVIIWCVDFKVNFGFAILK